MVQWNERFVLFLKFINIYTLFKLAFISPILNTFNKAIGFATYHYMQIILLKPCYIQQCTLKGVLAGTGRQTISAIVVFLSYYVLALPIGIPLMFLTTLRIKGENNISISQNFDKNSTTLIFHDSSIYS